ncbi:hypothetical protein JIN85_20140 [Luteolibacter pohnpeiensis]|uniref:Uncharacterized protein n=1 Tax=Luteolibacter pohnpeiensis TaxID=454153 RepID=A0A934SGG4_9BACT|nr:hypothetical protein [Luteolibacter pohnpeiensis]MBK1884733.1 hypothetical protein [Luteolibacter pohnpeiensis]
MPKESGQIIYKGSTDDALELDRMLGEEVHRGMLRVCVTSLLMTTALFGEIGGTITDCRSRYGEAVESTPQKDKFFPGGLEIGCRYSKGVCVAVSYRLKDYTYVNESLTPTGPRLSANQIEQILRLNSGGSSWDLKAPDAREGKPYGFYETVDGKVRATVTWGGIILEDITWSNEEREKVGGEKLQQTIDQITSEHSTMHSGSHSAKDHSGE